MDKETAQQHRLKGIHRAMKLEQYPTGRQNKYNQYNSHLIRAIDEYFNRGTNGLTVQQIADENGLSRSTIYKKLRHYHNRWYNHQYHIDPSCSPFLRGFVGSKDRLLTTLEDNMPNHFHRYFEIFVGSGSLLFAVQPSIAVINDTDTDIMNAYKIIEHHPRQLIKKLLQYHAHWSARQFYFLRKRLNYHKKDADSVTRTAQLVYLQATSFDGALRDRTKATKLYTAHFTFRDINIDKLIRIIEADSRYLKNNTVKIFNRGYKNVTNLAKAGDFVYIDPPYDSSDNAKGSRHDYSLYYSNEFTESDQLRLYKLCHRFYQRGVKFMETNADSRFIRNLYQSFAIHPVKQQRTIGHRRVRSYGQLLIKDY